DVSHNQCELETLRQLVHFPKTEHGRGIDTSHAAKIHQDEPQSLRASIFSPCADFLEQASGGAEKDESFEVKDENLVTGFGEKFQLAHGSVNVAAEVRSGHGVADDVHSTVVMHEQHHGGDGAGSDPLRVANHADNRQDEQHDEIIQSSQFPAGLVHPLPQKD